MRGREWGGADSCAGKCGGNCACDFCNRYNGPDTLPLAIFDAAEVATLNQKVWAVRN